MTFDYLEQADDEALQFAKAKFVDFLAGLEEFLDRAREYGKEGDMRMLGILEEFEGVEDDIILLAKSAQEEVPPKNYHAEVTKIIRTYIEEIVQKEYELLLSYSGEETEEEKHIRIGQLLNIIAFYSDLYPELNLAVWKEKTEALLQ